MSARSKQSSRRVSWYRVSAGTGVLALGTVACLWIRSALLPSASAQGPEPGPLPAQVAAPDMSPSSAPPQAPPVSPEYANRVVAYIGNVAVTREELGEYLIARYGGEKLEHMVNKRIIEDACKARGIQVSAADVEADLVETIRGLNITQREFIDKVLKNYRKTLYEWKEDVVRPKLMMNRYCRDRVVCTPEDLQKAFDAYYGEKVECRMILWPLSEKRQALMEYARLRDSEEAFAKKAKEQATPTLAAKGGKLDPFGRNCFGNADVEREIFTLHPGELTSVIEAPEGLIVLKLDGRKPANTTVSFNAVREQLTREILEKKTQAEIPRTFVELRKQANVHLILKDSNKPYDLISTTESLMAEANNPLPQGPKPGGR
jgi:hypothetical protein